MASFVESATLRLIDESSGKIRRINSELSKLFATARKGKRIRIDIDGLDRASSQARKLSSDLARLRKPTRVNVTANTRQAQSQINGLVAQINRIPRSRTIRINTVATNTGAMPQNIGPQGRGGARNVPIRFNTSFLETALHGFVYRLTASVERAVIDGIRAGYSNRDTADTRLDLQNVSPADQSFAQQVANEISRRNPQVGRGQVLGMISENMVSAQGDVRASGAIAGQQAELVTLLTALGQSAEEATASIDLITRAGESSGRLQDATGKIDPKRVEDYFDTVQRIAILQGKQFKAENISQSLKYLRGSKFGISEDAFIKAALTFEELGTSASVGLNQAVKSLSGRSNNKRILNNLKEYGLIDSKQVPAGSIVGVPIKELVAEANKDQQLLNEDFFKYASDVLFPAMRGAGLDPQDINNIKKFAYDVAGTVTAQEALITALLRAQELEQQTRAAEKFDVSAEGINALANSSGLAQIEAAKSQINSLLGEIANSMESIFIPVLKSASGALGSLAEFVAGPDGEGSPGRTAALGAGAAVAGAGALFAGKKLIDFFNPLTGAATALSGSAGALDGAAAALMRAAAAQGAGGVTDMVDGPGGRGKGKINGIVNALGAGALGVFLAGLAIEAGKKKLEADKRMPGDENAPHRGTVGKAVGEFLEKQAENRPFQIANATIEAANTKIQDQLFGVPEGLKSGKMTPQERADGSILAQWDALSGSAQKATPALDMLAASASNASQFLDTAAPRTNEILDALSRPSTVAEPTGSALDLVSLADSSVFESGARALEATFMTGADSVSVAGDQAGAAITAGGAAAGQSIVAAGPTLAAALQNALIAGGQAAASAIQAAGANIRVNVSQPGPNTGTTAAPVE